MYTSRAARPGANRRSAGRRRVSSTFFLIAVFALLVVAWILNTRMLSMLSQQDASARHAIPRYVYGPTRNYVYPQPALVHQLGPMPLSQSQYDTPLSIDEVDPNCVNVDSWQSESHLSCNSIHDLEMSSIDFINCGSDRCAFSIEEQYGPRMLALKMRMAHKEVTTESHAKNMHDTIAMERLTQSPYVVNIYANCGTSQLIEYSSGGNIHDFVKRARMGDEKFHSVSPLTKLKIAYQLATAVADTHSLESDGGLHSLAHNDLCCHQFILVDGVFKLNDFHLSVFLLKSPKSGRPCKFRPSYNMHFVKLRAPEEIPSSNNPFPTFHVDAADVFMLGNVLYYIHTYHWLFEGLTSRDAMHNTVLGITSAIPEVLLNSTDRAVNSLTRAIRMCWRKDPAKRPSAREISRYLKERLLLEGVNTDAPIKVTMPTLPADHRYTDSDFNANFFNADKEER